jgi:hypothetical protein
VITQDKANSSEELLEREAALVLLETAKEKLKGAAQAGLVASAAAAAVRAAVVRTAATLHAADTRARTAQVLCAHSASLRYFMFTRSRSGTFCSLGTAQVLYIQLPYSSILCLLDTAQELYVHFNRSLYTVQVLIDHTAPHTGTHCPNGSGTA